MGVIILSNYDNLLMYTQCDMPSHPTHRGKMRVTDLELSSKLYYTLEQK